MDSVPPLQVMTARSRTFSSSRTLPGQPCDSSCSSTGVGDAADLASVLVGEPLHEVSREHADVVAAIAERRHGDGEDVQAEVEIAAEPAGLHFGAQIAVGRGDHPRLHGHRARRAQALELALLQNAQQLGLRLHGQLANLVQEERPFVRHLEASGLRRPRIGERAALVAEQLALEQCRGNGGAADAHELPGAVGAALVNTACHHVLARARFAEERGRWPTWAPPAPAGTGGTLKASLSPSSRVSGTTRTGAVAAA